MSEGCNYLIKTERAHLIESGSDLAAILRWSQSDNSTSRQTRIFEDLTEMEQLMVSVLRDSPENNIDTLASRTQLPLSELASVLLSLEFKGIVKPLPGKRYIIVS